jgi:hypothetical protein
VSGPASYAPPHVAIARPETDDSRTNVRQEVEPMMTRPEIEKLRRAVEQDPSLLARSPETAETLLCQAEYALDCARLLERALDFPAEPYGEAEKLKAMLTDGVNEIWNRWHAPRTAPPGRQNPA